ncbi:MAG: 2-iminoacetate synthase ThiH [Bacteroidetes bacterium]|nr:2-iminoacetate synthase ThiH [Bacteroidota bacterium]
MILLPGQIQLTTFNHILADYNRNEIREGIYSRRSQDVESALNRPAGTPEDFMALISPAAAPYLGEMAELSNLLTQKRFGKTIQLYLPLYLSNECTNHCLYCGFNHDNRIDRVVLTEDQILKEVEVIRSYGYEHILLVTGEHPAKAGMNYFRNVLELIRPYFSLISMEVQPLEEAEYRELIALGLNTVYLYQETYKRESYSRYHPKGKKADFDYRLDTPDRMGRADLHRIGLGCLLGLEDWRTDSFFTAMHLRYLQKKYWKTRYSISFPRLRPHEGRFIPPYSMTDKELVQLICAYRIFDEELDLSMSVRESKKFRDNIIRLGITSMSAGSRTEPGGYTNSMALRQFEVHDDRTPAEIATVIRKQGYDPVWKDWDVYMQESFYYD